jgi:uncharacterized MAPEG superfamily protein
MDISKMNQIEMYYITVLTIGVVGFLSLVQLLIADITAIKQKHTPGYPINPSHQSFLFRATRAHSNLNESIAIFILFALFGILSSCNPYWLNIFSLIYLISRILYMSFYYANLKLARSASFGISILSLLGMFVISISKWL